MITQMLEKYVVPSDHTRGKYLIVEPEHPKCIHSILLQGVFVCQEEFSQAEV